MPIVLTLPLLDLLVDVPRTSQIKADFATIEDLLNALGLADLTAPAAARLVKIGTDGKLAVGELLTYYLAASSYTAADVLAKLLTVDGAGSGLLQDNTAFALRIYNNAGTLQHSIGAYNAPATASSWAGKISGASPSYTTTPTGTDASTAMSAGGKISATNTNSFILNTAQQTKVLVFLDCVLAPTATVTSAMRCNVILQSRDVNGVTLIRPEIAVWNNTGGTTWAAWALDTTNIPAGATLQINCKGYLV